MRTFDNIVKYILEADATTGVPDTESQALGSQIVQGLLSELHNMGAEEASDYIESNILKSTDPKIRNALTQPIIGIDRLEEFGKLLGILNTAVNLEQEVENRDPSSNGYTPTSKGKEPENILGSRPGLKPGIAGSDIGVKRGTIYDSDIEQAFKNIAYDFNQGTFLKKLQMVGKGVSGFLNPTAGGSTGVFA